MRWGGGGVGARGYTGIGQGVTKCHVLDSVTEMASGIAKDKKTISYTPETQKRVLGQI